MNFILFSRIHGAPVLILESSRDFESHVTTITEVDDIITFRGHTGLRCTEFLDASLNIVILLYAKATEKFKSLSRDFLDVIYNDRSHYTGIGWTFQFQTTLPYKIRFIIDFYSPYVFKSLCTITGFENKQTNGCVEGEMKFWNWLNDSVVRSLDPHTFWILAEVIFLVS